MISSSQRPLPDNTQHSQQTDIPAPRWDSIPTIPAGERPQTYALDSAATGTGQLPTVALTNTYDVTKEPSACLVSLNRVWPDGSSSLIPSKLASAKTLLILHSWLESPLRPDYPEVYCGFRQSFQENEGQYFNPLALEMDI